MKMLMKEFNAATILIQWENIVLTSTKKFHSIHGLTPANASDLIITLNFTLIKLKIHSFMMKVPII